MQKRVSLAVYTFSHYCVDFACFYMLFFGFRNSLPPAGATLDTVSMGFLLYNILAFGLQPLIGYACDARKDIPIALIGCGLLLLGLALISFPWTSLVLCALGNACFHIGGGISSLVQSDGKMAPSGIYVSSGAIGVSLGMMAGQSGSIPLFVPMLLITVCGILILTLDYSPKYERSAMNFQVANAVLPFSAVLVLCLISVVIRAYIGAAIPLAWRNTPLLILLPGLAACAGKAAGGYIADAFGAKNTGVITLLLSIPLLCLGYGHPVFCTVGIFLFNITMPVTLCAVASVFPYNPGLSFGLTTLGLLCGSVPTSFFVLPPAAIPAVSMLCILASVACLSITTVNQKENA